MILQLVHIFMPINIICIFIFAPLAMGLGDSSRILYIHVPLAWVSTISFILSGFYSIRFLLDKKKTILLYYRAFNAAFLGLFFAILTTLSGSIWAKITWGSFWNWDPRETSILIMIIIYIAYISLHGSITDRVIRSRVSSVYLIFAMILVPFFIFIIPRMYPTLHPDPILNKQKSIHMDYSMRLFLLLSVISFSLLYAYLYKIANRYI